LQLQIFYTMKKTIKKKNIIHKNAETKGTFVGFAKYLFPIIIVILCFTVFSPMLNHEFTNWDDNEYVTENKDIQSLSTDNISKLFSNFYVGNYHPLTMLSLAVNFSISGDSPKGYLFTNLLLHTFNSLLVFWFLMLFTKQMNRVHGTNNPILWISGIGSILFAISTLHVESIAWIAERKDLLYAFFFFASLVAYLKYVNSKMQQKSGVVFFIFTMFLFVLSLLSKGQAVSLSLVILLIDWILKRKLVSRPVILEKIPFFLLSLLFGILAVVAQQTSGAIASIPKHGIGERFIFAFYGLFQYIFKLVLPQNLSALYSYPDSIGFEYILYAILGLSICISAFYWLKKMPFAWFGFLFFVSNIVFVLQLLQVGGAVMADRYVYVASAGFYLLPAIVLGLFMQRNDIKRYLAIFIFVIFVSYLTYQTTNRLGVWKNSLTLWDDVLSKYTNNPEAWVNRANYKYYKLKDYQAALNDYNAALKLRPELPEALSGRGVAKRNLGDYQGAIVDYDLAIKIKPNDAESYSNRGVAKAHINDYKGAIEDLEKSLSLKPENSTALSNLGSTYFKLGDYQKALKIYDKTLEMNPNYGDAYMNRAGCRYNLSDIDGAMKDYQKAIEIDPNNHLAYMNRALIKQNALKDWKSALEDCKLVLKLKPNSAEGNYLAAQSYFNLGDNIAGCESLQKSSQLGFSQANSQLAERCK